MFDPATTDQHDLHGGTAPWAWPVRPMPMDELHESCRCDVVVVGAGITGALAAEHLTRQGYDVCVVERERPGLGSTAASTAMVLWEIDQPLRKLAVMLGFDRAAHLYRQSFAAASGLCALIGELGIDCALRINPSLYIAAAETGPHELLLEHGLRVRAGLPGDFLDHRNLLARFGIGREAALVSQGSADIDPVRLSQGLLAIAIARGARLIGAEVSHYDSTATEAIVGLSSGKTIEARWLVLATGYLLPDFMQSDLHTLASSWVIATPPQPQSGLWPEDALIWEASDNYHYARTTSDRRIILGGEDDEAIVDPHARDALIAAKAATLRKHLPLFAPHAAPVAEFAWSGAFGKTADGLPLIGPIPGQPRMLGAYGYGGNGITFSFLASRIVADVMRGDVRPWFEAFAFDRDVPK